MPSLWKKLFIIVTVLLVISLTLIGILWGQLVGIKIQLNTTETQLEATKAELDTTETQLEATKAELDTTETQLEATKTRLEAAENERIQMLNHYSNLREQINMRLGHGQDAQSFITPNDPVISARVSEITGGYSQDVNEFWRDYERLYRWVTRNIEYSYDSSTPILPKIMSGTLTWSSGFWRMPTETLKDETGDCEDMAVLLASMLLNYNEERFAVWAVGIETSSPEPARHIALAFPVKGNQLTILDPAGNYYSRDYLGGSLRSYDVAVAVNRWLSHWAKDMPGAQIYVAFSNEFRREFSSTEEFINWVHER